MSRPLNTLFLLEDLCFGGTQKQNLELARRLDRKLFQPRILTLTGRTDLDELAASYNLPVTHLGNDRKAAPFFFLRLKKAIELIKPDILVPCTALPNIWGRIWGKVLNLPVVVGTCRGGGAPVRQHEWLLWRLSHAIVCNSPQLVQKMASFGVPEQKLAYIPNGVDTDFFSPCGTVEKTSNAQTVVCVARLAKDKDHKTLLRAFAIVADKFPQVRLRLVGEGPEENGIKAFVQDSLPQMAANLVEFAGACADPRPHYAQANIFALASIREGQPNVILEAMSCGLPVCATNVGGIPSLVEDGTSGLLCEAEDAETFAGNLIRLLDNPPLATRLGAVGRKLVQEKYSFDSMVNAHQQLFMNLWERYGKKL